MLPAEEIRKKLNEAEELLQQVRKLTHSEDVRDEVESAIGHIRDARLAVVDLFEIGE